MKSFILTEFERKSKGGASEILFFNRILKKSLARKKCCVLSGLRPDFDNATNNKLLYIYIYIYTPWKESISEILLRPYKIGKSRTNGIFFCS